MNEVGELFLRAMLQVTILAVAAAGLYGCAVRRGPAPAARVASLALGLSLLLTVLALCPLPSWWGWKAPALPPTTPPADMPSLLEPSADTANGRGTSFDSAPTGWSSGDLWRAFKGMLQQAPPIRKPAGRWQGVLALLVFAGVGLEMVRLLLGLWAVHACRRRARPIEDVVLRQEVELLGAALDCRRAVEVCESADLHTPATLGWLRPVVLLPAGWRGWSTSERQAVLAHELAHVQRADYLGVLLARLGVALHFYHPVVYWLAGRLRLQQELAADASAARVVGGRGGYLLALAQLALRQDGRPPRWPAASFLFSHGTLLKRIAMLRAKERSGYQRWPRLAQLLTVALLLAAGLFASTLRGPKLTAAPEADSPEPAAAKNAASASATAPAAPFDLTYIPPEAMGVVAMRPAALFGQPGMHKYALLLNGAIAAELLAIGKQSAGLSVADIEQVVLPVNIHHAPKAAKGQRRNIMFGPGVMVRTVKEVNWEKLCRAWLPGLAAAHHGGVTYYRIPKEYPAFGPEACLLFPDGRTVVGMREKDVRRVIDQGGAWKKAQSWGDHWKEVERDLAAVTYRPTNLLSETEGDDPKGIALMQAAERMTVGVESCARPKVHFWVQCRDEQGCAKWEQTLRTRAKERLAENKETATAERNQTALEKVFDSLSDEMLSALHLTRQGAQLMGQTQSQRSYASLAEQGVMASSQDRPQAKPKSAGK